MQDIVIVCQDLFGIEIYSIVCEINKRRKSTGREPKYNIIGFVTYQNDKPFEKVVPPISIVSDIDKWYHCTVVISTYRQVKDRKRLYFCSILC